MPKRKILILDQEDSPWPSFLEEFFDDTPSTLEVVRTSGEAGYQLGRSAQDILFIKNELVSPTLVQKIKSYRQSSDHFRIFQLGTLLEGNQGVAADGPSLLKYDASFYEPLNFLLFQSQLTETLAFPDNIRVLLADDEPEIPKMLTQYLQQKSRPRFSVEYTNNGRAALAAIEKQKPDVMVLDIKMPELGGHAVYREIIKKDPAFPVIVFFDAIFGDEIMELHKIGNPAIVEKGSQESTVPNLYATLLKMVYFA